MDGLLPLAGEYGIKLKAYTHQLLPGAHTMNQCNVIAIDLAKNIFQVCIMSQDSKILFKGNETK